MFNKASASASDCRPNIKLANSIPHTHLYILLIMFSHIIIVIKIKVFYNAGLFPHTFSEIGILDLKL